MTMFPDMPQVPSPVDAADWGLLESRGWGGLLKLVSLWLEDCRRANIVVGPGRGSSAASPSLKALGIVSSAVPQGMWQRFIGPGMDPDIDIDMQSSRREDALKQLERLMPGGWSIRRATNADGSPSVSGIHVVSDGAETGLKIDLLPSRELDVIDAATRYRNASPADMTAARALSDWSWQPIWRFLPGRPIDWESRSPDFALISRCPQAFFQLRASDPAPIRDMDELTRAIARMRPSAAKGGLLYQEDAMTVLLRACGMPLNKSNALRHATPQQVETAKRRCLERCSEQHREAVARALDFLTGGYGFCRAHAAAYATVIAYEASLPPYALAWARYQIDPKGYVPKELGALTGRWRPSAAKGDELGGIAHLKGIGHTNAHAISHAVRTGHPLQSGSHRPDATRLARLFGRIQRDGMSTISDRLKSESSRLVIYPTEANHWVPAPATESLDLKGILDTGPEF